MKIDPLCLPIFNDAKECLFQGKYKLKVKATVIFGTVRRKSTSFCTANKSQPSISNFCKCQLPNKDSQRNTTLFSTKPDTTGTDCLVYQSIYQFINFFCISEHLKNQNEENNSTSLQLSLKD